MSGEVFCWVNVNLEDRMEAWWKPWQEKEATQETVHQGFFTFRQELRFLKQASEKVEALISSTDNLARELPRQEKGWWVKLKQLYWSLLQEESEERAGELDGKQKRWCQWYQMNIIQHNTNLNANGEVGLLRKMICLEFMVMDC